MVVLTLAEVGRLLTMAEGRAAESVENGKANCNFR